MIQSTGGDNPLGPPGINPGRKQGGGLADRSAGLTERSSPSGGAGFSGLPGRGDPPRGDLFICPNGCGHQWRRFFVADRIPECPKDHVRLVPAPRASSR